MDRGRHAESPTEIPAKGWKDILLRVKDEIGTDQVGLVAAGIAFYGLLAIFPGIAAAMAVAGLFYEPQMVTQQLDALSAILPAEATDIILGQAQEVAGSREGGLTLAAIGGVLIALWSASKGVDSLVGGMNIAYDETEKRGFIKRKAVVLVLTLGMVVGLMLVVGLLVAVPAVLAFMQLGATETWAMVLRWPLVLLVAWAGISILYRYGPSRANAEWRWITPGAGVACLLWLLGTAAFALYVRSFASYNETFGTLGGVVVLLMWLWLTAYVILLGAELDSEMEAQTRVDTTTGPNQPMGSRGAVKADNLGAARGKGGAAEDRREATA